MRNIYVNGYFKNICRYLMTVYTLYYIELILQIIIYNHIHQCQ